MPDDVVVTPDQWCVNCRRYRAGEADGQYGVLCPVCSDDAERNQPEHARNHQRDRTIVQQNAVEHLVTVDEMNRVVAEELDRFVLSASHRCYCVSTNRPLAHIDVHSDGAIVPNLDYHVCTCPSDAHHLTPWPGERHVADGNGVIHRQSLTIGGARTMHGQREPDPRQGRTCVICDAPAVLCRHALPTGTRVMRDD